MPTTDKQNPTYVDNQSDNPIPVAIVSGGSGGGETNYALETGGNLASVVTNTTRTALVLAFDKSVLITTPAAISADTAYRDEVTLLADVANTDAIKVGGVGAVLFPLVAGASITIKKTQFSLIYAVALTATQVLHVITGGI
jgi:hypothetical protein